MTDILMTRNARCDIETILIIFLKMISDYEGTYFDIDKLYKKIIKDNSIVYI